MGAGYDHCELSLEPELHGPNKHADELLVNLFIDWREIIERVEDVHRI